MAETYGTKLVFGVSNFLVSVLALLTPVLAKVDVWCVLVIRLLQVSIPHSPSASDLAIQGSLEAFAFPSLNTMVSKWVPEDERSAFISFAFVGGTFGSVITNPLCGLIISSLGWESVFYITGGISAGWCLLWLGVVSDSPEQSKIISEQERKYILNKREYSNSNDKDDVPMIPLLV